MLWRWVSKRRKVGECRSVARDLLVHRIDGAAGVEIAVLQSLRSASARRTRRRCRASRRTAAARRASAKSAACGRAISFGSEPSAVAVIAPSDVMIAATAKPNAARALVEIGLEQRRVGLQEPRAARKIARGQFGVAQQRLALRFAIEQRGLAGLADEVADVAHERGIDRPFHRDGRDARGDQRRVSRRPARTARSTRVCSRAPAREARRAARSRRNSITINDSTIRTTSASPPSSHSTTSVVGMIGVKPAKMTKVASARTSASATAIGPNRR